MSWRAFIPTAVALGLIVLLWRGLSLEPGKLDSPLLGKPAPAFDLPALHDPAARVRSADFAGRHFALNVWGTWCPECYREHGTLLRIAADGRVPLVGLNWRDERPLALEFLRQRGDPFVAVAFDPEGDAAIDWGVYGAPETFLVDAQGRVVHKHIGPLDWQIWTRDFVPLLSAEAGP